jgi:hypothetical protein
MRSPVAYTSASITTRWPAVSTSQAITVPRSGTSAVLTCAVGSRSPTDTPSGGAAESKAAPDWRT